MGIASIIMAAISIATSIGTGIASHESAERGMEAQERVDIAQEQFDQESADMARMRDEENRAFSSRMLQDQKKRDKIMLGIKEQDIKDQQGRNEAAFAESILTQKRSQPMSSLGRTDRNILKLTGGGVRG